MAREKPFYRENLELLNARYPDHDMLLLDEVAAVMGWKSRQTTIKRMASVPSQAGRYSKAAVADYMCGSRT